MTRLLHIPASPSRTASRTRAVAARFIAEYRRHRPSTEVHELDIWSADLPPFDADMIAAKFAVLRSTEATPAQRALWQRAVAFSEAFNAADLYVLGVPMWNFGVPYRLKHLIDVVTLPGQNWRWSAQEGYVPLLRNKKAVVVYSSAGDYPRDAPHARDHQKPLVREWLAFLGVAEVQEINVAPTLAPPAQVERSLEEALREAGALAAALAPD